MTIAETVSVNIGYFDGTSLCRRPLTVIRETSVTITLNGQNITTNACTGIHLDEMAAGYLKSTGLIRGFDEVVSIEADEPGRIISVTTNRPTPHQKGMYIGSSGARSALLDRTGPPLQTDRLLSPHLVLKLIEELLSSTTLHDATGGAHCSALASHEDGIIIAREDIGRHNTIDMVCGYGLLKGLDLSDKIILTTGRVSSEIVRKIWRIGVPFIISHSAATSRAVEDAEQAGITVVGYVRRGTMRIYSQGKRVEM
ncbi:MAG: formate dehydrogenase accessory sulfurtransferase FdhD [Deltaproteobacteria bacterium]|nr:formate dehydrogenase accessory sulfurtransferase FdhD [Deltaproteobacteria bacterium]